MEESGEVVVRVTSGKGTRNNKKKDAKRVEGVWVVNCESGVGRALPEYLGGETDRKESDEDEMIWWSWEGKLVGFSDW